MPLRRVIVVLLTMLVGMMAVVRLRGELLRLNHELAQLDRREAMLAESLRERQLELARLRSPALIRAKLARLRAETAAAQGD